MTAEDRQVLVSSSEEEEEEEDVLEEDIFHSPVYIRPDSSLGLVYVASASAALGGLIFGYDVGVIAGARSLVARDLGLLCSQEELLVSLMPLGAVSSCLVSGRLLDSLGRKVTIQLTCLVFLAGSLLLSLAQSLPLLLAGRWLVGCGVSLSAISESCYISEIAAAQVRGRLITLNELGITLGFLLAFIVNFIFADVTAGWRIMFGLSSVFAVVQFILMVFMPESPYYLIKAGRDLKAIAVLKKIHCVSGVVAQREVTKIKTEQRTEVASAASHLLCSTQDNMRARLMVGLGLVLAQQLCGQPNVMYYAGRELETRQHQQDVSLMKYFQPTSPSPWGSVGRPWQAWPPSCWGWSRWSPPSSPCCWWTDWAGDLSCWPGWVSSSSAWSASSPPRPTRRFTVGLWPTRPAINISQN